MARRARFFRHVVWASLVSASLTHAEPPPESLKSVEALVAEAQTGVPFISPAQLDARIAANPRLVLLDVRTAREFDAGHLRGAAWVERGVAEFTLVRQLPDPDVEIVVYCKVGNRSGWVVQALRTAGYRDVVGLAGGIDEWARQGRPLHNLLGEIRLVAPTARDAASRRVDFFEAKR